MTALIWSSYNGHIEVVRELINRGADINLKTNNKRRRNKEIQHLIGHAYVIIRILLHYYPLTIDSLKISQNKK